MITFKIIKTLLVKNVTTNVKLALEDLIAAVYRNLSFYIYICRCRDSRTEVVTAVPDCLCKDGYYFDTNELTDQICKQCPFRCLTCLNCKIYLDNYL